MAVVAFRQVNRPADRPADATLKDLYNTFTCDEIAGMYKVSTQTVYQWINDIRQKEGGKLIYG